MSVSLVDIILNKLKFEERKKISNSNIKDIKSFDNFNKALSLKESTRNQQASTIIKFSRTIRKDFRKITKDDIQSYMGKLQLGEYTLAQHKVLLKKFFKWLYDTDDFPKVISWLKINKRAYNYKTPSEMLNEEEISSLINACTNLQSKAIISVLFDSATRVGELVDMNIMDVGIEGEIMTISVNGKTGQRTIELISSIPLLTRWLDQHPFKNDKLKPLWLSFNPRHYLKRLTVSGVEEIVKQASKRAEIQKRVTPHVLRHSKLTDLAYKGFTEEMLRKFAGWAPGSNMPMVYIHLSQKDVAIKRRELETGERPKERESRRSLLLPIICPRCNHKNDANNKYCKKCWLPLNQKSANEDLKILHTFRSKFVRKVLGINVEECINDYYSFKNITMEMITFYKAFNGNNRKKVYEVKKIIGWKLDKFENFIEQLRDANLIEIDNGEIVILGGDKTVFDNFLLFERMYVNPPEE